MPRAFAQLLSVGFHPLIMTTLLFATLLYLQPADLLMVPPENRSALLLVIFLTTYVVPALSIYFLYRVGAIRSLTIEERTERRMPFLYVAVFYALTTWLFQRELAWESLLVQLMLNITIALVLTAIITFFWQISAHSVAVGGVLAMLMVLNSQLPENMLLQPLLGCLLIGGAVMSARLALQVHTLAQVGAGFLLGFACGLRLLMMV